MLLARSCCGDGLAKLLSAIDWDSEAPFGGIPTLLAPVAIPRSLALVFTIAVSPAIDENGAFQPPWHGGDERLV